MLRSVLTASLSLSLFFCFAQSKEIEINQLYRYTVPEGKVVEITNTQFYKLILSDGSFTSGTSCNSTIHSNPSFIYGISYYENVEPNERPKTIGFTFKDLSREYDNVYQVKPYFLLKENMGAEDIGKSLIWNSQAQKIIFYPGTSVFPSSCIKSIMLTQREMTTNEKKLFVSVQSKRNEQKTAKDNLSLSKEKDEKQKKDDLANQRFNDPKFVYSNASIDNSTQIRFSDTIVPAIINCLALKLNDLLKVDYKSLVDEIGYASSVFIIGTWDNKGDIQTLKIADERSYNQSKYYEIDLLSDNENTVKLKAILKLNEPPMVELKGNSRACFLEADLFALKIRLKYKERFSFKKTNKKFIYQPGFVSTNKWLLEKMFNENYSSNQTGDYKLNLCIIDHVFTTIPELFLTSKEITLQQSLIFPY